jgi:hypothetical protein
MSIDSGIKIIYADDCPDCARMKKLVRDSISETESSAMAFYYNCEEEAALDVAVGFGITDIPGCYAFGRVFEGPDFDEKEMKRFLIEKMS